MTDFPTPGQEPDDADAPKIPDTLAELDSPDLPPAPTEAPGGGVLPADGAGGPDLVAGAASVPGAGPTVPGPRSVPPDEVLQPPAAPTAGATGPAAPAGAAAGNPFADLGALGGLGGLGALGGIPGLGQGADLGSLGLPPGAGGPGAPGNVDLGALFTQMGRWLSWNGGPINWDLARDQARKATGTDPSVTTGEREKIAEAVQLADMWLDQATDVPSRVVRARAWSRAEWVEGTIPGWRDLAEPVAGKLIQAISGSVPQEMAAAAGPMLGMFNQLGASLLGAQIGRPLGLLSQEVVGTTDIGVLLVDPGVVTLLPNNVRALAQDLGVPLGDVTLVLAAREAARHRLHAHAPWYRASVLSLLAQYAAATEFDFEQLSESARGLDPQDPAALQQLVESGVFEPTRTPAQEQILRRLEALLAVAEGWTTDLVTAACEPRLASSGRIIEGLARGRALGGPGEKVFAQLIGLKLTAKRLRDGERLMQLLREARGAEGRDAVWQHPDLAPDADALDDPAAWVAQATED